MNKCHGKHSPGWYYKYCPLCGLYEPNAGSPCSGIRDDNIRDDNAVRFLRVARCSQCHILWTSQYCGHCGIKVIGFTN